MHGSMRRGLETERTYYATAPVPDPTDQSVAQVVFGGGGDGGAVLDDGALRPYQVTGARVYLPTFPNMYNAQIVNGRVVNGKVVLTRKGFANPFDALKQGAE
jgi:hypothetical protein